MPDGVTLRLFRGGQHPCPYLTDRAAASIFLDPNAAMTPALYGRLLDHGFRRSGEHVYRPDCPQCAACRAARLPVDAFRPRRGQRRTWAKAGAGLRIEPKKAVFQTEHYALYRRYLAARHADGPMAEGGPGDYEDFLTSRWCETAFVELRLDGRLLAVAVTDVVPNGLSAVYTFFEPDDARLGPGSLAILAQIDLARRWRLPWLYLGYWIGACPKMRYKTDYRPVELLIGGEWHRFGAGEATPAE
jgi:arginine-tRNA-protein transferase